MVLRTNQLGDLGESKSVVEGSSELFAGTTACFKLSREYLDGFQIPFEVVGGNHDLEGIDEFPTGIFPSDLHMKFPCLKAFTIDLHM